MFDNLIINLIVLLFSDNYNFCPMKNVVITGGNSGVGLETARGLFGDGHNIIIGRRNIQKNIEAVQDIVRSHP